MPLLSPSPAPVPIPTEPLVPIADPATTSDNASGEGVFQPIDDEASSEDEAGEGWCQRPWVSVGASA